MMIYSLDLGEECEIRIPANAGIAGWVFVNKEALVLNEPYTDLRFSVAVDCKTEFKTENILCVPLINSGGHCIGALSKKSKLYIGPSTYNMVREQIDCEFVGNRTLKNVSKKYRFIMLLELFLLKMKKDVHYKNQYKDQKL